MCSISRSDTCDLAGADLGSTAAAAECHSGASLLLDVLQVAAVGALQPLADVELRDSLKADPQAGALHARHGLPKLPRILPRLGSGRCRPVRVHPGRLRLHAVRLLQACRLNWWLKLQFDAMSFPTPYASVHV